MDPNDNNNISESVQLDLITVKAELKQELIENVDITEQDIHITQNINVTIDNSNDSTVSGQKRKHVEDNSLNVQEDESMSQSSSASKSIVKRRRYSDFQNEDSLMNSDTALPGPSPQEKEDSRHFTLLVTNLSNEWTSEEVIDFIKEQCGIYISKINDSRENTDTNCQMKLKFNNKAQLNKVLLKLKRKEVEGKLLAQIVDPHDESQSDAEYETMVHIDERETVRDTSSVLTQVLESDENPFHLKKEYLESLGIKLPLTNWVTVTNFRCDKTELKEVLELCGKVLVCSVVTISTKYANVMYSHPLEAVQAISMLNGQKLYGKPLKLTMNNAVDMKTFLPKGLQDLGPGLGQFGKPLPDLADQYKNFLNGKNSTIDAHLFHQDWVNKLGLTLEDSSYVRPVNSSPINDDSVSEQSRESSPRGSSVQANQFGPIGQRPPRPRSTPINRPQIHNNPITNFNNQPVVVPRGSNNTIPGQMQGPRAPNPNMAYQNCPPIPGVETNDPRTFQNGVRPGPMSGPIGLNSHMGPRPIGPMMAPSPRIPISVNNRFTGPMSPMIGPRPVGPGSMGPISHSGQIGPVGPVGQVGLVGPVGQVTQGGIVGQVSQIGQVGQAGLVGHVGQVGQMGRVGPVGQVGPIGLVGQIGQVGPVGQVGQVGQVNQGFQIGPRPGPNGPMPGQNVASHNIRPVMSSMTYMTQPSNSAYNVQMYKSNDPVTLQISNLPPTTNFVNLGQKLSELGHVVFLEFTTPGCAIVRFASPADAERCYLFGGKWGMEMSSWERREPGNLVLRYFRSSFSEELWRHCGYQPRSLLRHQSEEIELQEGIGMKFAHERSICCKRVNALYF